MKTPTKVLIAVAAAVGTASVWAFLYLVWPTPYHYTQMRLGTNQLPVRIHRWTERTEILFPGEGWRKVPDKQ